MFQISSTYPLLFTRSSGDYRPLISPNTGNIITNIQWANSEDIENLTQKLKVYQKDFKKVSRLEIANALEHISKRILELKDEFAHLIAFEGGKPLKDALIEVERASLTFKMCAEECIRISGEMIPMERSTSAKGKLAFTLKEAIGPVLAISAFNHPLNLLAHQIGCAIASGCVVVLKPAPGTPLNAIQLKKLFDETTLSQNVFSIVPCDIPEINKLLISPNFNYTNFIGSAKVGWEIRSKIAPGMRLSLEHGGMAPAIVCEDADLKQATKSLVKGSFYHAGQVCISTQKIYVHKSIREEFISEFIRLTKTLKTQDATLPDTDVGPLIRPEVATRITEWIKEAQTAGAKVLTGNNLFGPQMQFLEPTVVVDVPSDCKIMNEEIFGPVVCINEFENLDETIDLLSQSNYIFESCIFTNNLSTAMKAIREMSSMTLVVNEHNAFRVDWMPFGGHGLSGLGMGGVKYSIEEMTRTKQIIINS